MNLQNMDTLRTKLEWSWWSVSVLKYTIIVFDCIYFQNDKNNYRDARFQKFQGGQNTKNCHFWPESSDWLGSFSKFLVKNDLLKFSRYFLWRLYCWHVFLNWIEATYRLWDTIEKGINRVKRKKIQENIR